MTQINENLKLGDAKVFYPRIRGVFKRYGIHVEGLENFTLRGVCEKYRLNLDEFIVEISEEADPYLSYLELGPSKYRKQ